MPARQPINVTPELLRTAWHLRKQPHWPATFEATLADPLTKRLLRAYAIGLALRARAHAHQFDFKRAAAGDQDAHD